MPLITLSSELKANFSSVDTSYNVASLASFINDAEQNILIPWIGQDAYDDILAYYQASLLNHVREGGLNSNDQLLAFVQKAVTHLAFWLAADSGSFRISDTGFYVIVSTNNKPVSDKKMSDFKDGRREAGYRAMEQAIEYMEANIDDPNFADYATSDAHVFHRSYFINSSVQFTGFYKKVNNSAYLFYMLLDAIDFVERQYIAPVVGLDYFAQLKEAVLDNDLDQYQTALMPYICRALVLYTVYTGVPNLPVDFRGTNLVIRSQPTKGNADVSEDLSPANAAQISNLVDSALVMAQTELRNLDDYLQANAANLTGYVAPVPDPDPDNDLNDLDVNDDCAPNFFV